MKLTAAVAVVAACTTGALAASPQMVGTDPCTYGPSFWCASAENAAKCNFDVADCKKYCDNAKEYSDIQNGDICSPPGSNKCTFGPSYFCASKANAKECGVKASSCKKYCNKKYPDVLKGDVCKPKPKPKPVGSDKCTQGPSYFCASRANAKACGMKVSECKKYCTNEYPEVQKGNLCLLDSSRRDVPGSNKCTAGPSYWCASKANAKSCDFDVADCQKYCDNAEEYPDIQNGDVCKPQAVGTDKCTQGPSYFCASKANAKECGVKTSECKKYCNKEYPEVQNGNICKPKPKPIVGNNKCTQGPSYFCASKANAKECGVKTYECKKYCNKEYPEVQKGNICKP